MNKKLMVALLIIKILIVGSVVSFYGATATKKQTPVHVEAPVSGPSYTQ